MADSTSLSEDERKPLPAITRDFYLEHPDIAALTPEQVAAERERHSIAVQGDAVPNPVSRFVQASLPPYLLDTLLSAGYKEPTAIQRQAWPVAMSGRDLVGLAETGSGKTLAYLLPALVHVIAQPMLKEGEGPLALVLAPTRELAVQIHEEAVRFGHPCSIRTVRPAQPCSEAVTTSQPAPRCPSRPAHAPREPPIPTWAGVRPVHQPPPPPPPLISGQIASGIGRGLPLCRLTVSPPPVLPPPTPTLSPSLSNHPPPPLYPPAGCYLRRRSQSGPGGAAAQGARNSGGHSWQAQRLSGQEEDGAVALRLPGGGRSGSDARSRL